MFNKCSARRCFFCLQLVALVCVGCWTSPTRAATPPVTIIDNTPALDRHSQSPRLQTHSRTGARYEVRIPVSVTEEQPPEGEEIVLAQGVDINSASAEELAAALPGIGPSKASSIVEWREANGPFRTIEQLLEVSGIGPRTLENIRPFVRLSDALSQQRKKTGQKDREADVVLALSSVIRRAEHDRREALRSPRQRAE